MARRIESLLIEGPAGRLEAVLEEPGSGAVRAVALVCHPHPKQGGTMHNKVVYRLARGFRQSGAAVLRFNFRGVGLSEGAYDRGEGELEDARAALAWLRSRYAGMPVSLAGFSFGSRVALRLACSSAGIARAVAAGFPAVYRHQVDLSKCLIQKVFIQSRHDHFASLGEITEFVDGLPEPKRLYVIDAADHFFTGALEQLEELVGKLAA